MWPVGTITGPPGGGTDPVWLRFLASEKITKLGPAPNCSLDTTFNDAEILHGVIAEHMKCWYYHWIPVGGTDRVSVTIFGIGDHHQTWSWLKLQLAPDCQ